MLSQAVKIQRFSTSICYKSARHHTMPPQSACPADNRTPVPFNSSSRVDVSTAARNFWKAPCNTQLKSVRSLGATPMPRSTGRTTSTVVFARNTSSLAWWMSANVSAGLKNALLSHSSTERVSHKAAFAQSTGILTWSTSGALGVRRILAAQGQFSTH